jgi:hypothetical protein
MIKQKGEEIASLMLSRFVSRFYDPGLISYHSTILESRSIRFNTDKMMHKELKIIDGTHILSKLDLYSVEPCVIDLHTASIIGESSIFPTSFFSKENHGENIITLNHRFLRSKSIPHAIFPPLTNSYIRSINSGLIIDFQNLENYSHFLQSILAYLVVLADTNTPEIFDYNILIPTRAPQFVRESIDLLLPEFNLIETDARYVRITNGYIMNQHGVWRGRWVRDPRAIVALRERALQCVSFHDTSKGNYLLIDRSGNRTRRIQNQSTLISSMNLDRTQVVRFEETSFEDQIRLMTSSSILIGVHGAGLANSIFFTGESVIELHGTHLLPSTYQFCKATGLHYHAVSCESIYKFTDKIFNNWDGMYPTEDLKLSTDNITRIEKLSNYYI